MYFNIDNQNFLISNSNQLNSCWYIAKKSSVLFQQTNTLKSRSMANEHHVLFVQLQQERRWNNVVGDILICLMPYGKKLLTSTSQSANTCSKWTIKALEKHPWTFAVFVLSFKKVFAHLASGSIVDPENAYGRWKTSSNWTLLKHVAKIQEKHLPLAGNVLQAAKMNQEHLEEHCAVPPSNPSPLQTLL